MYCFFSKHILAYFIEAIHYLTKQCATNICTICIKIHKITILIHPTSSLSLSMEFEYLSEIPILTLDVNEDFKGDMEKCSNMIEKV